MCEINEEYTKISGPIEERGYVSGQSNDKV